MHARISKCCDECYVVAVVAHPQTKEAVKRLLDELPDDCTIDDVQYELYVMDLVRRGLAEADEGKLIPHEQVMVELRDKWTRRRES